MVADLNNVLESLSPERNGKIDRRQEDLVTEVGSLR